MTEKEGNVEDSTVRQGVSRVGDWFIGRLSGNKMNSFNFSRTTANDASCDYFFPAHGVIDKRFFIFDQFFQHLKL
ncbi:MAG: hypothetical protein QXI19_10765 [Candidatus Caldarchaeum sp.]